jgi:8-oxo-dGTP pyrophosphatase MutT (NUDIX family)
MKEDPKVRPWKTLESETAFPEPWMRIRKDKVQLPSGRVVDDYFVWDNPPIAHVAAMTPEGKIVMARQYRHAVGEILLVFPAGGIDPGEEPEAAARRELEEETGYTTDQPLVHIGSFATYETKLSGRHDVFFAPGARQKGKRVKDDQEETEVLLLSLEELAAEFAGTKFCSSSAVTDYHLLRNHLAQSV